MCMCVCVCVCVYECSCMCKNEYAHVQIYFGVSLSFSLSISLSHQSIKQAMDQSSYHHQSIKKFHFVSLSVFSLVASLESV
jgi:hypothetical protein